MANRIRLPNGDGNNIVKLAGIYATFLPNDKDAITNVTIRWAVGYMNGTEFIQSYTNEQRLEDTQADSALAWLDNVLGDAALSYLQGLVGGTLE